MRKVLIVALAVLTVAMPPLGLASTMPAPGNLYVKNLSTGSGATCDLGGFEADYNPMPTHTDFYVRADVRPGCVLDIYHRQGGSMMTAGADFQQAVFVEYRPNPSAVPKTYIHSGNVRPANGCPHVTSSGLDNDGDGGPHSPGEELYNPEGGIFGCTVLKTLEWSSDGVHFARTMVGGKSSGHGMCGAQPDPEVPDDQFVIYGCAHVPYWIIVPFDTFSQGSWTLVKEGLLPGAGAEIDLPGQ